MYLLDGAVLIMRKPYEALLRLTVTSMGEVTEKAAETKLDSEGMKASPQFAILFNQL